MPNGITQISRPLEHLCLHSDVSGRAAISLHACACVRACEDACVRAFARGGHVRHNPLAANIASVDGALVPMQAQKCAQASTGLRAPIQLHMKDGKREMPLRQVGKKGQNKDCTVPRQRHWIGPRLPLPWHHAIPSVHANLHAIQTSRALCARCGFAVPRVNGDRTRAALRSSTGRGGEGPQTGMRAQHR